MARRKKAKKTKSINAETTAGCQGAAVGRKHRLRTHIVSAKCMFQMCVIEDAMFFYEFVLINDIQKNEVASLFLLG